MMIDAAARSRLATLAGRLNALAARSLRPWLDVGLDPRGGAFGFLDRYFNPVCDETSDVLGPSRERLGDQSLVQQSRHLFSYSLMHARRPSTTRTAEFAHAVYAHLIENFSRSGSFDRPFLHWIPRGVGGTNLEALGLALDRRNLGEAGRGVPQSVADDFAEPSAYSAFSTQLYAQGFAVYALSTYALTFGEGEAKDRAHTLFMLLDQARHDEQYGGYDQTVDGGWLAFVSAPEGAAKCTNTHIHLLEALTPLCLCFPKDQLIIERLFELSKLIAAVLKQSSGYVHKFFARDGSPLGEPIVSYGHDLETSWLLLDAVETLRRVGENDRKLAEEVQSAAEQMAAHALRTGWDSVGGVFDCGVPETEGKEPRVLCREKVWWAQAESIPGILQLYLRTGESSLLDSLEQTFDFMSTKSWDPVGGEFFWGVDSVGVPQGRGVHKGEIWKTPYHALRACLISADWIEEALSVSSR